MKLSQPQILEVAKNNKNLDRLHEMMDEAKVNQFLLDNPRFLIQNPELLSHIDVEIADENTFSLVERQVKTLRDKNSRLQGQQIEMLQTAHANEQLLILCNKFMLQLVGSNNLEDLNTKIINGLKQIFNLDSATLLLVGNYQTEGDTKVYSTAEEIKTLLNCQFPDNQPLCGRLGKTTNSALFGDLAMDLQSCALVPLGSGCEKGLIALASNDLSRFDPEMGTLFVELIAKYVAALVSSYERS